VWAWLAGAMLMGCPGTTPEQSEAELYVAQLDPILQENGLVGDIVLMLAADLHDSKLESGAARARWEGDVVPLADHLRDQAAAVQAPAGWAQHHRELVEIWTTRADAYHDASDAIRLGDPERWRAARQRADAAKLREEAWFQDVNRVLAAYGRGVDQFP
jgi:hypothetical protein